MVVGREVLLTLSYLFLQLGQNTAFLNLPGVATSRLAARCNRDLFLDQTHNTKGGQSAHYLGME